MFVSDRIDPLIRRFSSTLARGKQIVTPSNYSL